MLRSGEILDEMQFIATVWLLRSCQNCFSLIIKLWSTYKESNEMYHRFGWAVTHRRGCQRGRVDRSKRWMIFDEMFDGERKKRKKSFGIYIVNPHNLSGRCPNSSDIIRYDFASQFSWMKLCSLYFLFSLFFEEIEMNCKIWSLKLSLSQRRRITYSTKLNPITFLDKVELETKSVRNKKLKRYRQSRDKSYLCLWVLVQLYYRMHLH